VCTFQFLPPHATFLFAGIENSVYVPATSSQDLNEYVGSQNRFIEQSSLSSVDLGLLGRRLAEIALVVLCDAMESNLSLFQFQSLP
jgi:hypothetical protein